MNQEIIETPFHFWGFDAEHLVRPQGWQSVPRSETPRLATVALPADHDRKEASDRAPVVQTQAGESVEADSVVTLRRADGSPDWWLHRFLAKPSESYQVSPASSDNETSRLASADKEKPVRLAEETTSTGCTPIRVFNGDEDLCTTVRIELESLGKTFGGRAASLRLVSSGRVITTYQASIRFDHDTAGLESNQRWRLEHLVGSLEIRVIHGLGLCEVDFSLTHRGNANHPGGTWDMGDWTSLVLDRLSIGVSDPRLQAGEGGREFLLSLMEPEDLIQCHDPSGFEITQGSSGGANWDSSNHRIPGGGIGVAEFGCRVKRASAPGVVEDFPRGRPIPFVSVRNKGFQLSLGMSKFWQSFPCSIKAEGDSIDLELLSGNAAGPVELLAGEQKTWSFAVECNATAAASAMPGWLCPSIDVVSPSAYETQSALPYLTACDHQRSGTNGYESLVSQAITGSDCFWTKSEKIDQFGWRHFGDIYGDHEAVFQQDPPLISHYNNQYDCTLGFLIQFWRTGNRQWYDWATWSADHAWDIDTYHTSKDKLLYNGGLFWHTYHYADAQLASHRSYPSGIDAEDVFSSGKQLDDLGAVGKKLKQNYAVGGGPAASHNYPTGWMYLYLMTGTERYREAAINAADYVIRIEDGTQTPYKWLSRAETGYSTCSSKGYYGPGRASGNSTHALLTGHQLTLDRKYLDRAAHLMRRTVHPDQNLDHLDLLNAELRWFYTMYLQALGRYVDYKLTLGEEDTDFRYGVASLLHYANWMAEHERPTLSEPDELQYPTETWAAQDMRKWHVLEHAARYEQDDSRRKKIQEKADFFYEYVVDFLSTSETKSLCRPVVLLMNFGWQRAWLTRNRDRLAWDGAITDQFAPQRTFVPQRLIAVSRFKKLLVIGVLVGVSMVLALLVWWFTR